MAYGPYYYITDWKNEPSRETPINRTNLLKIENGIKEADNRIVQIDAKKAELSLVNTMVKEIALDTDTGILTVTQQNGSVATYDLEIEKVVTNFDINDQNELVLTLADGTQKVIDLTRFVYSVDSTATVSMKILNRTITAEIVDGSVTMEKLDAAIQMEFRQYMLDTLAARDAALNSQKLAQRYAVGGVVPEDSEDNAKSYYQQTKDIKTQVDASAELVIPHFYIDFATGKLMSDTKAKGKRFWISNGILYGENVYGTMIRYSANEDGSNMTESRQPTSQYVGVGYMPREVYENENLLVRSQKFGIDLTRMGGWLNNQDAYTIIPDSENADFTVATCSATGLANNAIRSLYSQYVPITHGEIFTATISFKVTDISAWDVKNLLIIELYRSDKIRIGWRDIAYNNSFVTLNKPLVSNEWMEAYIKIDTTSSGLFSFAAGSDWSNVVYFALRLTLFRNGEIFFKKVKLERGDTATPWTPAPSDWLADPRNFTWTALNE